MSYHRLFDGMTIDGHEVDTSQLAETGMVLVGGEEWNADDLITEEDKLQIFEEDTLRTKSEILEDIELLLQTIANDRKNDIKHSHAYYDRYVDLIERFKSIVERCVFPEKLEDWWHYEYEVRETGVTLSLVHAEYIGLNDEGFIDSEHVDTEFDLIKVGSEMLTVEQYAQANEVTTTTVRQWIRRGKIRTAVKQGSEWRIPELAEVRERGYSFAQYKWENYLTGFPDEFSYINEYSVASIRQNDDHKDIFEVTFRKKNVPDRVISLTQKEKEKLELLLISNPYVDSVDSSIVYRG